MKEEIWKPIKGFEGWYEVSNKGRVKSLDRVVYFKNNKGSRKYKGKILKQKYHNGYALVNINKNKKIYTFSVHILVATAFIDNPNNYPLVHHKDGVKSNNDVSNLEWSTYSNNITPAIKHNLLTPNLEGINKINEEHKIEILCYKDNCLIKRCDCSRSMAKWLIENNYIKKTTSIESAARAIRKFSLEGKQYYGFIFKRIPSTSVIEKPDNITIKKDEKNIITLPTSSDCAKWLLENHYIINAQEKTIARSIRKAVRDNKPYHNFIFEKLS